MRRLSRPLPTLLLIVGALLMPLAAPARAGEVRVAVAANFAGPMAKLGEGFTAATNHTLLVSVGATGKFYSQIVAGAPFDVLIAADDETPARLVKEGLAVPGSSHTYATGRLVLWSAQPGLVDPQGAVLASGSFKHLAIANPRHTPYGQATMEVLKARGVAEALAARLVTGETIAQTYQFVATGNAELGFVALSQVAIPGKPITGSGWPVPAALHTEIRQDAVLLKTGERNAAAQALLAYLKGDAARRLIQSYGYGP